MTHFNFLPDRKKSAGNSATGARPRGFDFLGGGGNAAHRPARGVGSPLRTGTAGGGGNLFAHLAPERSDRMFGMGRKARFRLGLMVGLVGVLLIVIAADLPGAFMGARDALSETRLRNASEAAVTPEGSREDVGGYDIEEDDGSADDADPDVSLPGALPANSGDTVVIADDDDDDSGNGDNGNPADPPVGPAPPLPDDPAELLRRRQERIAEAEASFGKERPAEIPEVLMSAFDIRLDDVYRNDYGELHHFLLQTVADTPVERLRELAVTDADQPGWYALGQGDPKLFGCVGRSFRLEATLYHLQKIDPKVYNLEGTEVAGEPLEWLWRGVLALVYREPEISTDGRQIMRAHYGKVQFSALPGSLPDGVTPDRVYDPSKQPLRLDVTGLFLHLRPWERVDASGGPTCPHLVLGVAEVAQALDPAVDAAMMQQVDDATNESRKYYPFEVALHLLYHLRYGADPQQLRQQAEAISWGDLYRHPNIYREKPSVVRFEGQIGQLGDDPSNPLYESHGMSGPDALEPNPYGIRRVFTGAMVVLDERGQQQNVFFDALNIRAWDAKAGEHYDWVAAREAGQTPAGNTVPASPLAKGDEVVITGYPLFKWSYLTKNQDQRFNAPRLVVHTVVQMPPRISPVDEMKWVYLVGTLAVLVLIFWLFRRESREASEFRREFMKKHVRKAGPLKAPAGAAGKAAALSGADATSATVQATDNPVDDSPPGDAPDTGTVDGPGDGADGPDRT